MFLLGKNEVTALFVWTNKQKQNKKNYTVSSRAGKRTHENLSDPSPTIRAIGYASPGVSMGLCCQQYTPIVLFYKMKSF